MNNLIFNKLGVAIFFLLFLLFVSCGSSDEAATGSEDQLLPRLEIYSDTQKTTHFNDAVDGQKTYGDNIFILYPKAGDSDGNEPTDIAYAFESGNTAVVTVSDKGVAKVVGAGTTTITVTASHANYADIKKTVTISVAKKDTSTVTGHDLSYPSLFGLGLGVEIDAVSPIMTKPVDLEISELTFAIGDFSLPAGFQLAADGTISGTPTSMTIRREGYPIIATVKEKNTKYKGTLETKIMIDVILNSFTGMTAYTESEHLNAIPQEGFTRAVGDPPFTIYPKAVNNKGVEPSDTTYAFDSSVETVLTVDSNGTVTIVGAGNSIISITASHSFYADYSANSWWRITVIAAP